MLNIFKKKTLNAVANTVKEVFSEPVSVAETIEKIHNDFDTSTERLLNEAKEIIANSDKIKIDKANRLKELGFSSSKEVTKTEQQIQKDKESKELAALIMHYKQWYPLNKFITEKEVKKICEKYGLIFGAVRYFKGNVPDKNLSEMEAFKLREEDMEDEYSYHQVNNYLGSFGSSLFNRSHISDLFDAQMSRYLALANSAPQYEAKATGKKTKRPFEICASKDDFDTRYMTVNDGYKLAPIPDPIVLQPVKGGYLIVTKWGLEASDEIVVNEINN